MDNPSAPDDFIQTWRSAGDWHARKAVKATGLKQQEHRVKSATLERCADDLAKATPVAFSDAWVGALTVACVVAFACGIAAGHWHLLGL